MKISDCVQGSDEWLDIKRGIVSASHFADVKSQWGISFTIWENK